MSEPGALYVVGVGPGDPELLTLKAVRLIRGARVVAYFAKRGRPGYARRTANAYISPAVEELRFEYPFTTELVVDDPRYRDGIETFYTECTARISLWLDVGHDVVLLCEGDPFFYGSSLAVLDRIGARKSIVVPGITGMSGCWASAGAAMVRGDDILTVLPGTLDEQNLSSFLVSSDAAVIIKLGDNLAKIRAALQRSGRLERAIYVERGTMADERILPMTDVTEPTAPYFALVLVPGQQRRR
jgi:precorrin-2/cobalt-factor-2 C20-methyltransferase